MKAAGVSPRKLAVHAGVDAKTVGRWLSGESQPRKLNARAAGAALRCRPEEIWPDVMNQPEFDASPTVLISSSTDAIAGLRAVYPTRTQFLAAHPLDQLFAHATDICMSGLSLNLLCQQYPDTEIIRLLSNGVSIRCLFLKPGGHHISDREAEEHHAPQVLSNLTTSNIHTLQRIQTGLSEEVAGRLQMRLYDDPVRFNIMRINSAIAIVQLYLPGARGVESPTLVIEKRDATNELFGVFSNLFEYYWDRGEPVA
jgi:hypothetical protein